MQEEPALPPDSQGHELDVRSEGVDAEVVERFLSTVRFAHQVISSVPQFTGVAEMGSGASSTGRA